jgi:hypothetical protein
MPRPYHSGISPETLLSLRTQGVVMRDLQAQYHGDIPVDDLYRERAFRLRGEA